MAELVFKNSQLFLQKDFAINLSQVPKYAFNMVVTHKRYQV